jgi:segregation and condensation protein A
MHEMRFELASDYLVMAAMLAEIKSRMLLPRPTVAEDDEADPRAELVRRLQEYERFKRAAAAVDGLPRMERDTYPTRAELIERPTATKLPDLTLREMLLAFGDVMRRVEMFARHHIQREPLSVRQRMSEVLTRLNEGGFQEFHRLFDPREGRMGVTVTFLAVLELLKESLIEIVQAEAFAPMHVRIATTAGPAGIAPAELEVDAAE